MMNKKAESYFGIALYGLAAALVNVAAGGPSYVPILIGVACGVVGHFAVNEEADTA
jgi:hypothetical protein